MSDLCQIWPAMQKLQKRASFFGGGGGGGGGEVASHPHSNLFSGVHPAHSFGVLAQSC